MNIWTALSKRFKAPAWASFREVGDATGASCRRHADVVAMGIWPSRGMEIVGVEVKESRSDWLREVRSPDKAEEVFQYCDRWYLAVSEAKVAEISEVPPTWGLLVLEGAKLVERKAAPPLTPKPISKAFVAALLRRAAEHAPAQAELDRVSRAAHAEGYDEGVRITRAQNKYEVTDYTGLKEQIEAFEKASGIRINSYSDGKDLGNLVRVLGVITSGDGNRSLLNVLRANARDSRQALDKIEKAVNDMEAALGAKA